MHGLVNRSIECFLRDTYGPGIWAGVAVDAGLDPQGFEALELYDDAVTDAVLSAAMRRLDKPREALLEDLGIYLVGLEPLRRLLRFGGESYEDFLHSLDELPDRVRLAVADLHLPELALEGIGPSRYRLCCAGTQPGFGAVFAGILRAMADDYGALALIEPGEVSGEVETVGIELLDSFFAAGRDFDLALPETR
ncbi:MAG: heme NO-binding domain-containing protein [Rhodobacteraceae bacterium]|jgi:hypothetical protein|nr:heme NO-binding domain-containing protein [uncultured Defluviimonas sp.]MCB2125753.1 heme NO-binding domain-containing protein [Paracoccaceae bacterium]MCC0069804.1 heme NO-binding domain-containing protein [Paracoccaceae bacterium]